MSYKAKIMEEFRILFWYNDKMHKAGVLRTDLHQKGIEYDIRAEDSSFVHKFGQQIAIFRELEKYSTHNHISQDYADLFNGLVNAIRLQDQEATNS